MLNLLLLPCLNSLILLVLHIGSIILLSGFLFLLVIAPRRGGPVVFRIVMILAWSYFLVHSFDHCSMLIPIADTSEDQFISVWRMATQSIGSFSNVPVPGR